MRTPLLALALLLAGCLSEPAGPDAATPTPSPPTPPADADAWHFGGAWTAEHTQADIDAWCDVARAYDNECIVMESFPPQYSLRFATEAACLEARAQVLALEHVTARECAPRVTSDEPETPTSSPPQTAVGWTLHGTFVLGYTPDDVAAVCEAGTGEPSCAMMKSEPPQYSFRFDALDACEEARAKILTVASARPGECEPQR